MFIELCCPYCFYENMHEKHKVLKITDEEILRNENITLESSSKLFSTIINKIKKLKEKIEEEINKINNLYEKTISNLTKAFQEKHEELLKQENEMKEKLKNEVFKTKEKLESLFSETNNEILLNERINAGLKNLEKKEKNNLRILSYISQINKNYKKMFKLSSGFVVVCVCSVLGVLVVVAVWCVAVVGRGRAWFFSFRSRRDACRFLLRLIH